MNPKAALDFAIKATLMVFIGTVIVNTLIKRVPVIGPMAAKPLGGL